MSRTLQDAIKDIVQNAQDRAIADVSDVGFSKVASAVVEDDELSERLEKCASALDFFAETFAHDPSVSVEQRFRKAKEAAHGRHPGVGSKATKLQTVAASDGKQSYDSGKATQQITGSELQAKDHTSKTLMADNDSEMKAFLGQRQPQISKVAQEEREALKARILAKTSGARKGNEPNISGSVLAGPSGVSDATGGSPIGKGAAGASMINSIDKVINLTKGQAKSLVKKDLGKVLKEPALSKSTDPVLHNNLRNASKAGVKIASIKGRFAAVREGGK